MARTKDLPTEISAFLDDDYGDADGLTAGSRKWRLARVFAQYTASRRNVDMLFFDGTTAGSRVSWALGSAGNVAGGAKSLGGVLQFPSAQVAQNRGLFALSDSPGGGGTSGKTLVMHSYDADLYLRFYDGGTGNYRQLRYVNAVANLLGLLVPWTLTHAGTTAAPVLYLNGQVFAGTETTTGSPGAWDSVLTTSYLVQGVALAADVTHAGRQAPIWLVNSALTAAEALVFAQTGRLPIWCELVSGSMVPSYTSDFSASLDSWDAQGGYTGGTTVNTANVDTSADGAGSPPSDNWQKSARVGGAGAGPIGFYLNSSPRKWLSGRKYLVTFDVFIPAGSPITHVTVSGWTGATTRSYSTHALVAGAVNSISTEIAPSEDVSAWLRITNGAGATQNIAEGAFIYLKNYAQSARGLIFKSVVQPCRILDDAGSNGICGVLTTGVTPITDRKDWRFVVSVNMSSTGNKQLANAALFETPQNQALDSIEPTHGANGATYSIGDGTTATAYTASAAQTSGRKRLTLANPFPADSGKTGLYANVTVAGASETAVPIVVRGHRTD